MPDIDRIDDALERGYNVRAPRPDFDQLFGGWSGRSESFRAGASGFLDVAYGNAERRRLDIFPASATAPTLVYLHGGYWQSGDKSAYSFLAEPFINREVSFVVMNYTLCPRTTVPDITEEIRHGLAWLRRNGARYGLASERINVIGHSAGGHLTAMMLATDWCAREPDLPGDLVRTGVAISGLYDLEPLRYTSINRAAGIDDDAARHCSPLFLEPRPGARLLTVVGGHETDAFHEQAGNLAQRWTAAGTRIESHVEPDVDHFDVINRLADAESALFNKVRDWVV
ncbi:MAG: alpha/beta hydrolase [Arenicellales bacterium]